MRGTERQRARAFQEEEARRKREIGTLRETVRQGDWDFQRERQDQRGDEHIDGDKKASRSGC